MQTIYALSSGALPAGVAIVRISGPACREVMQDLCGTIAADRLATLRTIRRRNGAILDTGIVLFFSGPASFTGEDCLELHLHGGRAVVSALLDELSGFTGLRHAEPGEFSRRAFQNGKLDLVQVEGLADLIAAETEMQRRLALEHADGGQSAIYAGWAKRLTHARAMIEAEIDFADEDDVPGSVSNQIWPDMALLRSEIQQHVQKAPIGEIIRDGLKVVISGAPNVGKSSLINALAKRNVAIVTDIAGTTRDVLSVDLDLDGFAVRVYDTAGLRDTDEVVEVEGIRRARTVIAQADLVLLLTDGRPDAEDLSLEAFRSKTIRIRSKIDINRGAESGTIGISTETGEGLDQLIAAIRAYLSDTVSSAALSIPTRQRHIDNLTSATAYIDMCLAAEGEGLDIQTEYLRLAGRELGRITGQVDVEQLLDVIFSQFCIGK
ncbi:tRNA uridine-5-carboxymethylaminomethyl(34) synthesis GTPase MnmE [Pararhizobium sp.]|uniref:tRNA uridine-5-carboxymethylaminomethyl(34) synthesis GTPase MnmE n=1 Tax=Pararhizobium sp. TaxID=1977563 RepID=UPI002716A31A|nr:tRNA uridine-5-carboxymethylaminomethyl(34) synthesis GTPase MnmE [Pararhizobium sp.]MDO9416794.1 tRNA uridine-5-carboxymethylaminomethyl(34) synthesis GTPase MnmE [Pararhizobium sp.]